MRIKIPDSFQALFEKYRYKVFYGGRGSAKSWSFAIALLVIAMSRKVRILCVREIQNSIGDSVHKTLSDMIELYGWEWAFTVEKTSIRCNATGAEFLFSGMYRNITKIKSMEGIDICWVEEAHSVSNASWEVLIPTIRKDGSEIWISFNREREDDPVYTLFVENERDNSYIAKVNYSENPFFPEVLRKEMEYDKRVDYDKYLHVWEGEPVAHSDAQVFKGKWKVETFETPNNVTFFHGADWGFSIDPTCLVRCYIVDRRLYIDYESYGVGVELDDIPELFNVIPTAKSWLIIADSARPETISHIRKKGYTIIGASQGKGSIEDGIEFIRSFEEIVIHSRCKHTIDEMKYYSYKKDKLTDEVLNVIEDKHNHIIDSLRYSLERVMRQFKSSGFSAGQLGL